MAARTTHCDSGYDVAIATYSIKYNIRAYTITYSKRKSKERNEQKNKPQNNYASAKVAFETNPTDSNSNLLKFNVAKENLGSWVHNTVDHCDDD